MRSEDGITLLETIMLIAIIGMLAILSIPRSGSIAGHAAHTTARQLIADMRYTRGLAIATAKTHVLRFSAGYTEYTIFNVDGKKEEQVGETREIRSNVACSGPDQIIIYSFGNADSSGIISVVGAEDQYDISIVAATGRVY